MPAPTVNTLLAAYHQRRLKDRECQKIVFHGVVGLDVYNPTKPFLFEQQWIIAARVEARDSEFSQVCFFRLEDFKQAYLLEDAPVFNLQDPFICQLAGELVFGGVEVAVSPENPQTLTWRTRFWRGNSFNGLRHFADGPQGMKDIRLAGLSDGRILLFTRPEGTLGGRGKIGWTTINSLDGLNQEAIESARLLEHVDEFSWCGVNEAWEAFPGCVHVLAHVACFDQQGNRHYYAAFFQFDVALMQSSPITIIAERDDFLPGEEKRSDLIDVIFPGGLLRISDNESMLFSGTSDCEVQWLILNNFFMGFTSQNNDW
jgi:hypothetical protein